MGRGRWLLCEREKRWKGLGEVVPTYLYSYSEREGRGVRKDFFSFTTITTTYG